MDLRSPHLAAPRPPAAQGFTAIELLVVIAIVAILATLAAPSFIPQMQRWRVRQAAESLKATLYFARSEAIRRGGRVVVEKLPNNTNGCATAPNAADWGCGWIVCDDTNANGRCQAGEPVLQRYDAPANIEITRPSVDSADAAIVLNRWGTVDRRWPGFTLTPKGESTTNPATLGVCMSAGGRIRIIPAEATPCT